MPSSSAILVIDDEQNLRCTLSLIFMRAGHLVSVASSADEARHCLKNNAFDLVFLDLKSPDVRELSLLHEIHTLHPDLPVLLLTAHAGLETAMDAVHLGARDYLLKPVDPALILARVEEILAENRQDKKWLTTPSPTDPTRFLHCGPLSLDLHALHVIFHSQFIPLSQNAFHYLVVLVRHSPNPVSLLTLALEAEREPVKVEHVKRIARRRIYELRKALEPDLRQPRYIITVRGVGYRLTV